MYTLALLFLTLLNFASSSKVYPSTYGGPVEVTHLVTSRRNEFLDLVDCISDLRNPEACETFKACVNKEAKIVLDILRRCERQYGEERSCSSRLPLFASPEIPAQIFDCIIRNINISQLTPEERAQMVEFEVCNRRLYNQVCRARRFYD